jgi:hypothetical protein
MRRLLPLLAVLSVAALVALHTSVALPRSAAAPIPPGTLTPSATQAPGAAYLPGILREGPTPTPLPPTLAPTVPFSTTTPTTTATTTPTSTPTTTPTAQITHTVDLSGTVFFRPQYRIITNGTCQPVVENWTNRIDPDHAADGIPPPQTIVYPTVGYLYLYDETDTALPNGNKFRIYEDTQLNHLRYVVPDLLPGTYIARAFVGYKGNDDVTRVYSRLFDSNTGQVYESIRFTITPATMLGQVAALNLYLVMDGTVCPVPYGSRWRPRLVRACMVVDEPDCRALTSSGRAERGAGEEGEAALGKRVSDALISAAAGYAWLRRARRGRARAGSEALPAGAVDADARGLSTHRRQPTHVNVDRVAYRPRSPRQPPRRLCQRQSSWVCERRL